MTPYLQEQSLLLTSTAVTTSSNSSSPTSPTYADHLRRPPTPQNSQTYTLDQVQDWTEDQVVEWLHDVGFGGHEHAFADNGINGGLLLEIDHQTLKELEIPTVGERVKILSAVKQLRRDCLGSPTSRYTKDRPTLVLPPWDVRPNQTTVSPSSSSSLLPHLANHNLFLSGLSSHHGQAPPSYHQSQLQPETTRSDPNDKYSIALKGSTTLPANAVQRSNSFTRILGRTESKRITIKNGKIDEKDKEKAGDLYTPTSPSTIGYQRRNSLEGPTITGGIMSVDKVKQQCVRVFGEDGQHRIVEVLSTPDVRTIMTKVLHKFGIETENVGKYSIFVGSSDTGAARALSDEELLEICHSSDRPEKERLILRKKHLFVTHEEFKRKGTISHRYRKLQNFFGDGPGPGQAVAAALAQNGIGPGFVGFNAPSSSLQPPSIVTPPAHSQGYQPHQFDFQFNGSQPDKQQTLQIITSTFPASPSSSTHAGAASSGYFSKPLFPSPSSSKAHHSSATPRSQPSKGPRLRQFFGERPPSEIISSNLQSFFPNHKPDVLETAGINAQRMSMRRGSSASSRSLLIMPGSNSAVPRNPKRRSVYRDSVLPELAQTLGLELDKVSEDGDEEVVERSKGLEAEATEPELESDDRMDVDSYGSEGSEEHHATPNVDEEGEVRADSLQDPPEYPSLDASEAVPHDAGVDNEKFMQKTNGCMLTVDVMVEDGATMVAVAASEDDEDALVDEILEVEEEEIVDDAPIIRWLKGSLIGRGTFGDVYHGLNPLTGELMAVKQVELPVVNSATEDRKKSMVDALQREIALLKVLQHENIVQYLGSQSDEAHLNIFLEYVPGGSVAGLLASFGAFTEPLVRSFVRQILRGLCYLHERDIIHRDIKGANILVDNKGGVKISDFGISKKVEDDMLAATSTGPHRPSLQGSVFWMAPEVVKQTQYTFKADIWSLGCLVVEMFTGDHPFPEYSQMQAMFKIGTSSSPNIPENISDEAKDFLIKTFEPDFQERPSAQALLLHPFIDNEDAFRSGF